MTPMRSSKHMTSSSDTNTLAWPWSTHPKALHRLHVMAHLVVAPNPASNPAATFRPPRSTVLPIPPPLPWSPLPTFPVFHLVPWPPEAVLSPQQLGNSEAFQLTHRAQASSGDRISTYMRNKQINEEHMEVHWITHPTGSSRINTPGRTYNSQSMTFHTSVFHSLLNSMPLVDATAS